MPPPEKILQPRMALACNFAAMFQVLVNSGMIEDKRKDFEEAASKLKESESNI